MESRHVKSVNIDQRSNKRIKFASAKQRAKRASADVYRSHKRKIGATSAATREEAVHNPHREIGARKRQRAHHLPVNDERNKSALLVSSKAAEGDQPDAGEVEEAEALDISSSLAAELDETLDRNASEIFGKFHRQVWPMVRSLPEILHHSSKIVEAMLQHLLSPHSSPEQVCNLSNKSSDPQGYVVNHATLDILHLMAVLARDLRHEIHPHLHSIVRRIVYDLLNPPPPPPESGKQPIPLDVTVVEAAFRCLSYIFRYDGEAIVEQMESMRTYYGATLAARRELVRRLAAETFAPLIRKIKSSHDRHRHLKRVLKALVVATEGLPQTPHLKRTQQDAVDGISQLIFQVVRGVPGRLHSQGHPMVRFVLMYCTGGMKPGTKTSEGGNDLLFAVASTFLERLCRHVDEPTASILMEHLTTLLKSSLVADKATMPPVEPTLNLLRLFKGFATFRHGAYLRDQTTEKIQELYETMDRLFTNESLSAFSHSQREEVLALVCPVCVALQADKLLEGKLGQWLRILFQINDQPSKGNEDQALSIRNMTAILSRDLIPSMNNRPLLEDIGSITLAAAARLAEFDQDSALMAIFSLATKRNDQDEPGDDSTDPLNDSLLLSGRTAPYKISKDVKQRLLEACLLDVKERNIDDTLVERLTVALRCAAFIAFLPCDDHDDKGVFSKSASWYSEVFKAVDQNSASITTSDFILIKALALEGICLLASDYIALSGNIDTVLRKVQHLIPSTEKLLFEHRSSLWAMRGVSSFVVLLSQCNKSLNDRVDDTIDALVPNLSSPSHSLRLNTLKILATLPTKNFVTDYADLDIQGDLDEEPTHVPYSGDAANRRGPVGKCDIIQTLFQIESMKVQLTQERPLLGLISKVEVLARSGKLPVHYAEAAAHHMLGLFYVKFAPLWPVVTNAIVALVNAYENTVWPALEAKLVTVMNQPSRTDDEDFDAANEDCLVLGFHEHRAACIQWEESLGRSVSIFGGPKDVQDGEVHRHLMSDDGTVLESVWQVTEKCQHLVAKHSRVIVPTFLGFLTDQYFLFHSDDPTVYELKLTQQDPATSRINRGQLHKHDLLKRLQCFLRAFAAVEGPQQLVQHQLLEQIFRSFLTHHETSVVQLSLTSLFKFKTKHLVPYRDLVTSILEKGRLRNALLKFQEALESDTIATEHRKLLIPVLSRILFGRLSVRESRSGKDSLAAKRSAILSFVSLLCQDQEEIFDFVYLMIRNFLPRDQMPMKEVEAYSQDEKIKILALLDGVNAQGLNLQSGVIEGFLHLLQPVVAQLGHRIKSYIPTITSLVVALCQVVSVTGPSERVESDPESMEEGRGENLRRSAIRTLCYQRLSEMFSMYSRAVEFEKFSKRLWDAVGSSVVLLPEMVVKSERVPALLHLLETLSREQSLIPILCSHEAAVSSIIKCIAGTSLTAVMHSALLIVENLLEEAISNSDSTVTDILGSNIHLIMSQFTLRLKSGGGDLDALAQHGHQLKRAKIKLRQATWRKELDILCRISEFISQHERFRGTENENDRVLDDLTELLLPFLEPGHGTTDEDKLNVLGILKGILGNLETTTLDIAYGTLSDILGPIKGKTGIEAISVRHEIARVLEMIGTRNGQLTAVTKKVVKLNAINSKRVDELDFETIIPELNDLGDDDMNCAWQVLAAGAPIGLAPLVSICFHYLHHDDGVLARASFSGLKSLIRVASREGSENDLWIKFMESLIVPLTRSGLQARSAPIRRYYILIIRETSKSFGSHESLNLCGDLFGLIDEDNPDVDFFIGVTHVQIHRRARAFQRLRKTLTGIEDKSSTFSSQSLSGILLPIALHPAYECKTKAEESFALEGIATVGAISRLLPWNKYHNTIWSLLSSVDRHQEQERYLIGALCAIIDAFNFDLVVKPVMGNEDGADDDKTAVWRALERRIIPKIEGLLTKEKVERNGSKTKMIRPPVVLALVKLFQKFPESFFESKLPHILTVMCDALRNKDSDARDLARTTMAKIVNGMDLKYLPDVVRELSITLNEGYKLHVRSAVIHSILQELESARSPSQPISEVKSHASSFDSAIPAIMDILQEDLFGEANERRESQETNVRYVKEAGGSKSVHSIEIICRLLTFKPSDASGSQISKSSIHCVVSPLLERLRMPDINAATIRKIKEILLRVVIGLSHNPSVRQGELFPFVYATIQPFIDSQTISGIMDDDDESETEDSLKISGSKTSVKQHSKEKAGKVVEWRPSTLKHVQSSKAAVEAQRKERQELRKVKDGANAPKLTGSSRHDQLHFSSSAGLNDPATINAVVFGLNLLHAYLKKMGLNEDQMNTVSMLDPFVPLLTACVCNCRDNEVTLVAMKCIMSFLRFRLPSLDRCSKSLGSQALTFLSSGGSSQNQNSDMTQACFRTLTYLINRDRDSGNQPSLVAIQMGEEALAGNTKMPLNGEQMKVLLAFLTVSISESEQHNPALGLIKAVLSRKFMSPEFYDLMDVMLKINVRSQKASLRQQAASIFIRYLLDYPMSDQRFEKHLKQIVANISYEYQEGRLSAIETLLSTIEKLPDALLEQHAQLLFLPQVLQLVNDDAKECREAVSRCLTRLLARCSTDVLNCFHKYTVRWCDGGGPMQVASLQMFGVFVEATPSFVLSYASEWVNRLKTLLQNTAQDWEVVYFSLISVEKLSKLDRSLVLSDIELWRRIVECLIDKHPWIKLASCRNLKVLVPADTKSVSDPLEKCPGLLFEIVRNLCFQLNVEEEEQSEELADIAIKNLTLALPLLKERPDLCFEADSPHAGLRDPIAWLLRRLSTIAKPKGTQRRIGVYKSFAAFCTYHPQVALSSGLNLELMLEPLHRSHLEAQNEIENPGVLHRGNTEEEMTESSLARDVLQLIEEASSSEDFLNAYALVKTRARDKKDQRRTQLKAEAVQDPMGAALKKSKKHAQERQRKKRRVDDRRRDRGAQKKQRHASA